MKTDLEKLIVDVFNPQEGERVVLLNDFPTDPSQVDEDYKNRREMVETWHQAFSDLAVLNRAVKSGFTVEDIITYEPTGVDGALLPATATQGSRSIDLTAKMRGWGDKHIVVAIARYSPTGPIFSLQKSENNPGGQEFRTATMPGATMDMSAFQADYKHVAEKAQILAKELTRAIYAHVTFSTGHEMYFDLRGGRKGEADDGQCQKPCQGINLPSGEACISPYEGLDPYLGESWTQGDLPVMYDDELVVYHVKKGMIVEVVGDGAKAKEMRAFFKEDPARAYIAELGLGCNDKAVPIGRVLQDEKVEGMHWAYGYNIHLKGVISPDMFKEPKKAVHEDHIYAASAPLGIKKIALGIPTGTRLTLAEKIIMADNKYSPSLGKPFK